MPYEITGCFGRPGPLEQLAEATELSVRVAPDELLILSDRGQISVIENDPHGLVVDLTSAFAVWALCGGDRFEAFSRLSAIELPEYGLVQGLVAHIPAKVLVRADELIVIVSSVVSNHLHQRLLASCADLVVAESPTARMQDGATV